MAKKNTLFTALKKSIDAKKRLEGVKGNIEFIGNNIILKGATFKITI